MSRADLSTPKPTAIADVATTATAPATPGRFAYDGLERIIHERARLGIITSLVTSPRGLSFNDLKELCDLTDGNLSRHLSALVESGLIVILKESHDRRPHTIVRITEDGRRRFGEYIVELGHVVADANAAYSTATTTRPVQLRVEGLGAS